MYPICSNCGERMDGDGYTLVFHCPNAESNTYEFEAPDSNPVNCAEELDDDDA